MIVKIPYESFDFHIYPEEPLILLPYKGSLLRGGFGNTLKRIVCNSKTQNCTGCSLKDKCSYSYIFETPVPLNSKIMRKYEKAPHPFVFEYSDDNKILCSPGDELLLRMILVGKSVNYLPLIIQTFDELGKRGPGNQGGNFRLKKVLAGKNPIYDSRDKKVNKPGLQEISIDFDDLEPRGGNLSEITLYFLSPTRIIYRGRPTISLEFHVLIRNILRRMSLLYYFHCGGKPFEWPFRRVIEQAKKIRIKNKALEWFEWERYSSRQRSKIPMSGFVGSITFEGPLSSFFSLLKAGEILHVGKGTSFGLGKMKINSWD